MTNRRIIVRKPDETVEILIPANEYVQELINNGMTEEEAVDFIKNKDIESGLETKKLDVSEISTDRRYRNCWKWETSKANKIGIDMVKAKAQFMSKMRETRNKELQETDAEMVRINEIGGPQEISDLKKRRQSLRDIPQNWQAQVDAAVTTEDLDSVYNSNGGYGVSPEKEPYEISCFRSTSHRIKQRI